MEKGKDAVMGNKIETEIETLGRMLEIYCRGRHGGGAEQCAGCRELSAYALELLRRCAQRPKPACKDCPVHCFSGERRGQIKAVMRYAGPRMPLRHPLLTLRHWLGK